MSESFIEPDSLNTTFQSLSAIIDDDGATRFLNQELSSYNFDGFIPVETDTIKVNELEPGYLFLPVGESTGTLRAALKVEFDDPQMTDSPTSDYIISYLGPDGDVQTVTYNANDDIEIYREDWDNKILGNTGWTITQAGNAIFSNVAVRGRIEAQEGFLENLGITGILTMEAGGTINIGTNPGTAGNAGIVINESGIFAYDDSENETISIDAATGEIIIGGTPGDDLVTQEDIDDFITGPEVNTNVTSISGGVITTGRIKNSTYNGPASGGGSFSTTGSQFNIDDGSIVTPNFRVSSAGDASFRGSIFTRDLTIDAVDTANTGYIIGSEISTIGGPVSNIALSYYSGKGTFSHNGVSWTVDSDVNVTSLLRDQLYAYSGSNPFRSFILRSGSLRNNNTGVTTNGAEIELSTRNDQSSLKLDADFMQSFGNYLHDGALVVSGAAVGTYPPTGTVKATNFIGDGSGLTGVAPPVVISTSGPTNPSAYQDNTVWYVI